MDCMHGCSGFTTPESFSVELLQALLRKLINPHAPEGAILHAWEKQLAVDVFENLTYELVDKDKPTASFKVNVLEYDPTGWWELKVDKHSKQGLKVQPIREFGFSASLVRGILARKMAQS